MTTARQAAAIMGRKGGLAGRGASQRRSPEHYRAISGRAIRWQHCYNWGEVKIRSGKTGWIVETTSTERGEMTGRRVLVPYSDTIPRGADLSHAWNDYADCGGHLVRLAYDPVSCRVLVKGRSVQ